MGRGHVRSSAHHRCHPEVSRRQQHQPLCQADACDAVAFKVFCQVCWSKLPCAMRVLVFEAWLQCNLACGQDETRAAEWSMRDAIRLANGYLGRLGSRE